MHPKNCLKAISNVAYCPLTQFGYSKLDTKK